MPLPDLDDLPVDEIMRRWPQTVRLFVDWRMACVGCPIGDFHCLADAAEEHGYEVDDLRAALRLVIENSPISISVPPGRRRSAAAGGDP
jgi:hybrid cluster-associated redox disulfide protein